MASYTGDVAQNSRFDTIPEDFSQDGSGSVAGASNQGCLCVGNQNFNVKKALAPPTYSRTAPSADSHPQSSPTTNGTLSKHSVQRNEHSQIKWATNNGKTIAAGYGVCMAVGALVGGGLTLGLGTAIGAGIGFCVAAAIHRAVRVVCQLTGSAELRQMAHQAVVKHIKDPDQFQDQDKSQRAGDRAACRLCRDALQSAGEDWLSQQKAAGHNPTDEQVGDYINTCAKQLGEERDWDRLAALKIRQPPTWAQRTFDARPSRFDITVDQLKEMATDNPQLHMAGRMVVDHLLPVLPAAQNTPRSYHLLKHVLNTATTRWANDQAHRGNTPTSDGQRQYMQECALRLAQSEHCNWDELSIPWASYLDSVNMVRAEKGLTPLKKITITPKSYEDPELAPTLKSVDRANDRLKMCERLHVMNLFRVAEGNDPVDGNNFEQLYDDHRQTPTMKQAQRIVQQLPGRTTRGDLLKPSEHPVDHATVPLSKPAVKLSLGSDSDLSDDEVASTLSESSNPERVDAKAKPSVRDLLLDPAGKLVLANQIAAKALASRDASGVSHGMDHGNVDKRFMQVWNVYSDAEAEIERLQSLGSGNRQEKINGKRRDISDDTMFLAYQLVEPRPDVGMVMECVSSLIKSAQDYTLLKCAQDTTPYTQQAVTDNLKHILEKHPGHQGHDRAGTGQDSFPVSNAAPERALAEHLAGPNSVGRRAINTAAFLANKIDDAGGDSSAYRLTADCLTVALHLMGGAQAGRYLQEATQTEEHQMAEMVAPLMNNGLADVQDRELAYARAVQQHLS